MFDRLLDDSPEKADDRADLVAVLAFFAGVALALGAAGSGLEDLGALDSLIWIFLTGFSLGFAGYWIAGWGLAFSARRLGAGGSPRRVRHVLAFAFAPLAFALPVWLIWPPLLLTLAGWSLALLVVGLRAVYGWSIVRALAAAGLAVVWLAALVVGLWSVLVLLGRLSK